MSETPAKNEFQALIQQVVSTAVADNRSITSLRGVAFFDANKDAPIQSLTSFSAAEMAVAETPDFPAKFGASAATRVALQFVYEYFARINNLRYDQAAFDSLWLDFTAELHQENWITRGVANVRNFQSPNPHIDLGDGVTIRGRNFEELASIGLGAPVLEKLSADCSGFGASSFVLVAEETTPKRPENVITTETSVWTKAIRALGALRLAAAGDLSIGPMWVVRAARFNVGIGGISSVGVSIPAIGTRFVWTEEVAQVYPSTYRELAQLESIGYTRSPGNLDLALRSFMATYDRWPPHSDSKLIDAITGLEALLGSGTEIAFKLAFRVAALLAPNDQERAALLVTMKEFYDTRSRLVHGGHLSPKHQSRLGKVDELRSLMRPLLRSFVSFAANPPSGYDRSFFEGQLDAALINTTEREKLRAALGLGLN